MRWMGLLVCVAALGCSEPPSGQLATSLRLGDLLQEGAADQPFDKAEAVRAFQFPQDHGAHPTFRSEWWYVTANLEDADGNAYGVQFTVFRQALAPEAEPPANPWRSAQVYLAHFAVSEVRAARHAEAERLSRAHPELAGVSGQPPRIMVNGWALQFANDGFSVTAEDGEIGADLRFRPTKPIALQGEAGLSRKSPGNASYYYSFPNLAVQGSVRVGERRLAVTGTAWFDHEWSTSVLSDEQTGWDWFALHLEDGRDIMAFRLRRKDGARDPYDHGVVVAPDGSTHSLHAADYSLTPERWWQAPDGVRWPLGWALELGEETLQIEAAFDDQRMQTLVSYWEGAVVVNGAAQGAGYMELTGYDQTN